MRIGIFGGTFDPVHLGHLVLAEQCREQCQLDAVWFVPAGVPPHKTGNEITPSAQRVEMLQLAIAGHERFRVETLELDRPGPSYTVETLKELRRRTPDGEFFLLLGADSVQDLPTWREPREIFRLATIVAVNRGDQAGYDPDRLSPWFPPEALQQIQAVRIPALDLSSRDIRERVRAGGSIRYLVPRAVEIYLTQHRLYGRS